jgi:hypothetical protein
MKDYESEPEILLADEQSPVIDEIQSAAKGLLFDSEERFEFEPSQFAEEDWTETFVSYVLRGEGSDKSMSLYLGLSHDPRGILVMLLPFSEKNAVRLAASSGDSPGVEMVSVEDNEPPVVVNFFSHLLSEETGIRLEGVESNASEAELADLAATMRDPQLVEIKDELTVRYATLCIGMLRSYGELRSSAWDTFLARKIERMQQGVDQFEEREAAAQDRLDQLHSKIDHPARAIISEMVEPFSRKFARRILGL